MSRENVRELVSRLENGNCSAEELQNTVTPEDLIALGKQQGINFTEPDLAAFLRLRIANAESLPRPWGWPVARALGVVRN